MPPHPPTLARRDIHHSVLRVERFFAMMLAAVVEVSWRRPLSPCLVFLKLKDWKPPASAEESMTSTPYSLWFFLYSMTTTTRIATPMIPAARPE